MPVTKRSTPYLFQGQKNEKGRELPVRIQWNPEGTCYAVLYPSHLVIFNVEVWGPLLIVSVLSVDHDGGARVERLCVRLKMNNC